MRNLKSIIITLFCGLLGCSGTGKYKSIGTEEFAAVISEPDAVVLDVRTAQEYAGGFIDRAINIDVRQPDFERQALATLPKNKTIAVYCRSGKRSKQAAEILAKNGYKVVELNVGYKGWTELLN